VVPDAQLEDVVKTYADIIAANAPLTIGSVKFIVGQALREAPERDMDAIAESVKRCFDSRDYIEGRTAFMEKRKPVFTGK
jgi:enoyl-CoA hydratase/carnithine racemase